MGKIRTQDIPTLARDQFSEWPLDAGLLDSVKLHEIRDGQGINSRRPAQDTIIAELFNKYGRFITSVKNPLDQWRYIKWAGGSTGLKVDALGLLADVFGKTSGRYDIRISGIRNYIYDENSMPDDDSVDFNSVHTLPNPIDEETGKPTYNPVTMGNVIITEISKTRREIRVEGDITTKQALELFMETQTPGTMPPSETDTPSGEIVDDKIWPVMLRKTTTSPPLDTTAVNWMQHTYKPGMSQLQNVTSDADTLVEQELSSCIFKIPYKADKSLNVGDRVQIIRHLFIPFSIPVFADIPLIEELEGDYLRGPNLDIPADIRTGRDTILKSFDDLTGTDTSVKNQIIDGYLSGSQDIKLNHDYRLYDKWVHFGSAEEQLKNFKYKLQQIESYNSQSADVSTRLTGLSDPDATGSVHMLAHKVTYENKRVNMISSFTDYEKYLYYASSSTEIVGDNVYPPSTWPKENSSKTAGTYTLSPTTSSAATTWYNNQLESASLHDQQNTSMLRNTIPAYIRSDTQNSQYELFYDMIGQHFDDMYNVIYAMEKTTHRDESIDVGMSKDLIFDTAKSLGWTMQSGFDSGELWSYLLGTDSTGSYNNTGATYVKQESKTHSDIEKQTWKRILNNLPFLLKTKGTSRGLRALLASYGIPNTILRIEEYGGPQSTTAASRRAIQKFNYALNVSGSQYIQTDHGVFKMPHITSEVDSLTTVLDYNRALSMYECRIDTSFKQSGSQIVGSSDHQGVGPNWEVILEHSSSAEVDHMHNDYGRLVFRISSSAGQPEISASTDYFPAFDDDWWNISFGVSEYPVRADNAPASQSFTIRYAKIGEHADRITHSGSATVVGNSSSYSAMWSNEDEAKWFGEHADASTNPDVKGFSGSVQEIRGWAEYLSDNAFHKHVMAPTSVVGDSVEMAYNDLLLRLPLGTDGLTYNHHSSATGYTVTSSLPNSSNLSWTRKTMNHGNGGKFFSFDDEVPYSPKSETYYVDVPHTAGPRATSNKIRVETTSLRNNQLSRTKSFESSSHQANPIDTDEVTVALSPADQIDTDIAMQFGGFALADYIGDPRDTYLNEYTSLRETRNKYFKKYSSAYNVWAFIKLLSSVNTGLFKQIESLLPGRADATVGVIIRPNILERHKLNQPVSMSQETMYHTGSTDKIWPSSSVTADIASAEFFKASQYTHLNAPIELGVRASQQGASGSNTYSNRFNEGSEYLTDVFGEVTMSGVLPFVSKSAVWSGGEDFKYVPTFNIYNRPNAFDAPVSQSVTGSAAKAISNLYPKSIDILPNYIASPAQRRLVYEGIQISSEDWNVGSSQTIDGGPVAEYVVVNPNILRVKGGQDQFIENQVIDRRFITDPRNTNTGGAASSPGDTFVN